MNIDRRCPRSGVRVSFRGRVHAVGLRAGLLVALVLTWGVPASAQTLGEVTLVAAISSQLHPGISLPSGSFRAEGPGAAALIARLPDAGSWTDWEVYTARGLIMSLEQALMYGVERDHMVAGYYRVSFDESVEAGVRHTRVVFEGDGGRALLHVIREPDALVWLLARGR